MPHLRPTALAGLVLALVPAAALTSCGFDYPTDRVNTIAAGVNNRDGDIDALGIRILASSEGEGRLIGALANNLTDDASLDAVTAVDGGIEVADFEPVEVAGRSGVNLADLDSIVFTGAFTAGNVVPIELEFSTGEVLALNAPVVKPCYQYTQVPTEAPDVEEAPRGGKAASEEAEAEEAAEVEESAVSSIEESIEESEAAHGEGGDATFLCSDEIPHPPAVH